MKSSSTQYSSANSLSQIRCTTGISWSQFSQLHSSQSYVTTDGQSASLSWTKAHIYGLRPDLYYCQTVAGLLMWGALLRGRVCRLPQSTVSSKYMSVVSTIYILHVIKCIYNIHKASVSPGSVEQIMPYP
jgi:hypothetical protein